MVKTMANTVGAAGVAGMVGGLAAWLTVRAQLVAERIIVPAGAARRGGRAVGGPLTAYAQADFIRKTALAATGGRAYAEMDEGDPATPTAKDAALLRASLFTSILAFGLSAAGMMLGAVLVVVGRALSMTAGNAANRGD